MVALADAAVVAILTRAPSAGGKSRLFAALGQPPDPALLAALLLDTLDAAAVPGVQRAIVVEPPAAVDEIRALAPGVDVRPQRSGTLGVRMRRAMADVFAAGARAVAVVGSDIPDLQSAVVSETFAVLAADPAALVLGPALDGGYYLIAATRVPHVFDDIAWGTAHVLEQTIAAATRQGVRVHLLRHIGDVDSPADLENVRAPRTRKWVQSHS
jgi:rSAM/selenodomain-associated transferase 1